MPERVLSPDARKYTRKKLISNGLFALSAVCSVFSSIDSLDSMSTRLSPPNEVPTPQDASDAVRREVEDENTYRSLRWAIDFGALAIRGTLFMGASVACCILAHEQEQKAEKYLEKA